MAAPRDRIERRSFAPATADPGRHRRYAGADGGAREPGFAEAATRWAHHAGSPPPYAAPRRSVAESRAIEPGVFASERCARGSRTRLRRAGAAESGRAAPRCRLMLIASAAHSRPPGARQPISAVG